MRYSRGEMDVEALAERVAANASDTLFFFGDQADLEPLLAALAEQEQSPRVYLLPAFVPRPLFEAPPAVAVDLVKKSYEPVGAWHEVR